MKPKIFTRDKFIIAQVPYSPILVGLLRDHIDDRKKFMPDEKLWAYPRETAVIERLSDVLGIGHHELPEDLRALLPKEPSSEPVDLSVIDGYKFQRKPYEHQRRGLAELVAHDRWLLGWEQGCGKTAPVCDRIRFGFGHKQFARVLIACPKSVVFVWEKELREHVGLRSFSITGTAAQKKKVIKEALIHHDSCGWSILVVNYDALANLEKELATTYGPEVVIADECQALKNSTTLRSKMLRKIAANASYRWALSGTPAPNGPLDFFGTLLFFGPEYAGTPYKTAFEAHYAIKDILPNGGRIVVAYQNLSELNRKVTAVSSRLLKKDCLDLPEKVFVERRCVLEGDQARVYHDLRKDAVARLEKAKAESTLTVRNILSESLRLLQAVGGFLPDDSGAMHDLTPNAKMKLLREVLDEVGEKPTIIWCSFRAELAAIAEALADRQVRVFHGDLDDDDRKHAVDDFQAGRADIFLGTPQSGGMGITLTAADTVVNYSRTFNAAIYWQSCDRPHRIGQTQKVTIINLLATGTIDDRVDAALLKKERMQEDLLSKPIEELL